MKNLLVFAALAFLLVPNVLAAGLEITGLDVHVQYDEAYTYRVENRDRLDSSTVSLNNGSKIDVDILPGSNLTFTVRVENTLPGSGEDIKGIFATIIIEEIDDGADLEEDSIDFDLEPGDDERVDANFGIPLDADAGTYIVTVEAEGEDRNQTVHSAKLNFKLEVKKQSHDIRITKLSLSPSIVDCDRKAKLTAEVMNLGSNLENQVALEFKATSLGVNSYDTDITLESSAEASDEEKTHVKSLNIEVPDFFKPGTFPILISLYWKNFVLFDQKTADLFVRDCGSKPVERLTENRTEQIIVVQPHEDNKREYIQQQENGIITATTEISLFNQPLLLVALFGFFVVIFFVLILVIGYIRQKSQ